MLKNSRIAVIGGGPGGYVAAIRAAQLGATVSLIEKENLGGTCLNIGCIPTKALLHTAALYEEARNGAVFGIKAQVALDFPAAQAHKASIVKKLVAGVKGLLAANGVKVITGTACFSGPGSLSIHEASGVKTDSFDRIIIATGAVPAVPPIPGIDSSQCIDSTGALALNKVPDSMIIIGGGVIGMEMATIYASLGTRIQVVEMMDRVLPMIDSELTDILIRDLKKKGVDILTDAIVTEIREQRGQALVVVKTQSGEKKLSAERVLVAIGRKPAIEALCLDKTGIHYERGGITVNNKMETNVAGIYAIGDCNGRVQLAHAASAQGEVAAENAMGNHAVFRDNAIPYCVYTTPELAAVGLTEEQAKATGLDVLVGKFPLAANGKALIMNGGQGMIKVIAGKEHKEILGVHIVGPRATDLIAEAALAVGLEVTVEALADIVHAHPTVAEAMREAVLAVEKRAIHVPNPSLS